MPVSGPRHGPICRGLDLQVQAAVVRGGDRVGEARPYREIGPVSFCANSHCGPIAPPASSS